MPRKVLLFCIVAGFLGFLLAGIGLCYGVNSGISLGRLACLRDMQSADLALIKSISLSASNKIDAAIGCILFGFIFVGASGFLLGSLWMTKREE